MSKKAVQVYEYRGVVAIDSDYESSEFTHRPENNPFYPVCEISMEHVDITEGAMKIISTLSKNEDNMGDFRVTKEGDDVKLSWFGGYKKVIDSPEIDPQNPSDISMDTDLSLITSLVKDEEVEIPQEFKDYVDDYLDNKISEE